jgi:Uma2 family endonuclease
MTRVAHPKTPTLPAGRITYQEFLRRDGDENHVEWVDGEIVMMAPISDEHDDVAGFLYALLRAFVEFHQLGVVKQEPYQMKTGPTLPGRAPDVLFLARKNLSRLKKTHVAGPADLVIEVISPGSRSVDRGAKYYEYAEGGVKEYWLLDPERKQAEFYGLTKGGTYRPLPIVESVFRSSVIKGLWIKVEWLWRRPPVLGVQKVWKISR